MCNPFPHSPYYSGDGVGGLALGEGIKHEFVFCSQSGYDRKCVQVEKQKCTVFLQIFLGNTEILDDFSMLR